MAWPPAPLPLNRVNATPQQDVHPADHNTIALAVNDTVNKVLEMNGPPNAAVVAYVSGNVPAGTVANATRASIVTEGGWIVPGGDAFGAVFTRNAVHLCSVSGQLKLVSGSGASTVRIRLLDYAAIPNQRGIWEGPVTGTIISPFGIPWWARMNAGEAFRFEFTIGAGGAVRVENMQAELQIVREGW